MKSKLVAIYLAAAALSVPAVGYSAGTEKDTMPKDTMSKESTAPRDTMSRDAATPKKEGGVVSDAMITTKIKAELAKDKEVSAMKINVDTDKGMVTLRGTAKSKAEAEKAEMLAKQVAGVSSVRNDIKVQVN
jgi:hyperosmotically inducible periplasmic protein